HGFLSLRNVFRRCRHYNSARDWFRAVTGCRERMNHAWLEFQRYLRRALQDVNALEAQEERIAGRGDERDYAYLQCISALHAEERWFLRLNNAPKCSDGECNRDKRNQFHFIPPSRTHTA